jgi:hypothetical protein
MIIDGTVHNGVIVLESSCTLPEGTRVQVTVADKDGPSGPTHYELFKEVIGQAEGLPQDFAKNHNHYIRGGPKK